MVILVGKMASGKTTTANMMESSGYKRTITDTTRKIRPGEVDAIDYNFLTDAEFEKNEKNGVYAETAVYHATFGVVNYGSRVKSYEDDSSVIVLNPRGLRSVKAKNIPVTTIYLRATKETLLERLAIRGDAPEEIERRLVEDEPDFEDIEELADFIIDVDDMSEEEVTEAVLAYLNTPAPIRFHKDDEREKAAKRYKRTITKKQSFRNDSQYRPFWKPMIWTDDDGNEHRSIPKNSNASTYLKKQANRKMRQNAKREIQEYEHTVDEESVGRKTSSRQTTQKKEYDIQWMLD